MRDTPALAGAVRSMEAQPLKGSSRATAEHFARSIQTVLGVRETNGSPIESR